MNKKPYSLANSSHFDGIPPTQIWKNDKDTIRLLCLVIHTCLIFKGEEGGVIEKPFKNLSTLISTGHFFNFLDETIFPSRNVL